LTAGDIYLVETLMNWQSQQQASYIPG